MEMEAQAVSWEALLGRAAENLYQAGTSNRRLRARREPKAEFHPALFRQIDLVDAALVDVFRKLSHGQAAWPLFLHGPVGTGKTCASLALSDLVQTDWFGTVENAMDIVVQHEPRRWEKDSYVLPWLRDNSLPVGNGTSPLVVLDEVGARQKLTDLEYTTIKGFADIRELRFGRVAIYVSNLEPADISRVYDDRIASRLLCGTWFKLEGNDRRMGP